MLTLETKINESAENNNHYLIIFIITNNISSSFQTIHSIYPLETNDIQNCGQPEYRRYNVIFT